MRYLSAGPTGTSPPAPRPVKGCESGTSGLLRGRGAFPASRSGCVCGIAGGHVWPLSRLRLLRDSRRREQPRGDQEEKRRKNPIPLRFACPGSFSQRSTAHRSLPARLPGRSAAAQSRPQPPSPRRSRLGSAQCPRPPLRVQHAACLQHGCGDCGCRGVLPLLGTNEGMADAPFPAPPKSPACQTETRSPRGCPCASPGASALGCGSPLARVDRLPL